MDHEYFCITLCIISIHFIKVFVTISHSPFDDSGGAVVDFVSGFFYLPIEVGIFSSLRQIFWIAADLSPYFFIKGYIPGRSEML